MMICDPDEEETSKLKKCIQVYDLNNYKKLPNILAENFKEL